MLACGAVKSLIALFPTMPPYECAMTTTLRPCVVSLEMASRAASTSSLNVASGFPAVEGSLIVVHFRFWWSWMMFMTLS